MSSSIPQTSGIYKITCTANGKIYVGSGINLRQRWNEHRSELRRGIHGNPPLQSAWNKYGENSFAFEVIELVMPWSRIDREQYWLDTLKPYNRKIGFNVCLIAGIPPSPKGKTFSEEHRRKLAIASTGRKHTDETKKRLSEMRKGKPLSVEHREKISINGKGRINSPEHNAAISATHKGKIVSPETRKKLSDAAKNRGKVKKDDG